MASPNEFLIKQVNIQKEIVTFRCLSRALSIHVNVAKNELASFHASSKTTDEPVHATYLLTGDVASVRAYGSYRDENDMDVDDDRLETVSITKILLVGENELETAKAQFTRPPSVHIYSLSPSAIRDAALLAPTADYVRSQYTSKGKEFHQAVGIVVGADVKVKTFASKKGKANIAGPSKLKPLPPENKPESSDNKGKAAEKPKQMKKGTLDWSKAKPKAEKEVVKASKNENERDKAASKKAPKEKKQEKATSEKGPNVASNQPPGSKAAVKMESEESEVGVKKEKAPEKPKKGRKRPSAVMSLSDSDDDEQDNNPAPKTKPRTSASPLLLKPASTSEKHMKVKNGALISDDEDLDAKPKPSRQKGKGKGRAVVSDDEDGPERSVRTMMDLDDSHFIRHNKPSTEPRAKEDEGEEEDVDMISDSEPIPVRAKPKRKPKKVVPVGRNGLPKKRVVKSRKSKDARGYTITQDYSSYESVSESEAPAASESEKKKSKKGKKKQEDTSRSASKSHLNSRLTTVEDGESSAEQADGEVKSEKKPGVGSIGGTKSNGAKPSNGGKKNLMNYFGKK